MLNAQPLSRNASDTIGCVGAAAITTNFPQVLRISDTVIRALGSWPGANQQEGAGSGVTDGGSIAKAGPSTTCREEVGSLSNHADTDSKELLCGLSAKSQDKRVNPARSSSVIGYFGTDALCLLIGNYVGGWPRLDLPRFTFQAAGGTGPQVTIALGIRVAEPSGMPTSNPVDARAGTLPEKTAAITAARQLIPQARGGALLAGGTPGQRGGSGRPKESLRLKMRAALDSAVDSIVAALAGERLAATSETALLNDPRILALGHEVVATLADACRDHLTARLSTRELTQIAETLARYGLGTQQEREESKSAVRYVIRLPARESRPLLAALVPADRAGEP